MECSPGDVSLLMNSVNMVTYFMHECMFLLGDVKLHPTGITGGGGACWALVV